MKLILICGLSVLTATIVHHLYGAAVFDSPFRLHVALVAAPLAAVLFLVHRLRAPRVLAGLVLAIALLIGIYEGGYNHALYLLLHAVDADPAMLSRMYPPTVHAPPTDIVFEGTGVLQFGLGIVAAIQSLRLLRKPAAPGAALA